MVLESFQSFWVVVKVRMECLDPKKSFSREKSGKIFPENDLGFLAESWFFLNPLVSPN